MPRNTVSVWDRESSLAMLENIRDRKRASKRFGGRLSFDCFNLKCQDDRAVCCKGIKIFGTEDGSMSLVAVLRGTTSITCKNCELFEGEDNEGRN